MPAFDSTITTLSLLPSRAPPSHHHGHLTERDINRIALLDIAPDREALLMSNKSIEEIRQTLKIRTGSVNGYVFLRSLNDFQLTLSCGILTDTGYTVSNGSWTSKYAIPRRVCLRSCVQALVAAAQLQNQTKTHQRKATSMSFGVFCLRPPYTRSPRPP
jgi:hypothetical protein